MLNDIFQVDWIFIDTIIILLLILLLVSVKIFKSTHRWRSSFSNAFLDRFHFAETQKFVGNKFVTIKKIQLIRDSSLKKQNDQNPVILILRTNHRRKLLRILSEGLGTNGFNIISSKIDIKNNPDDDKLEKTVTDELTTLISTIINWYKKKDPNINQNYIILNQSGLIIPYKAILEDARNKGIILINPKVNNINYKKFLNVYDNSINKNKFYIIFSKKGLLNFPNKNLKCLTTNIQYQKLTELKLLTIEKAKKSYKYYETIVLGMIIDVIKNNILKLKT
ncbi:MAG: hypothetical protein CEE43_06155 [Promethearchaeota archaeon Loki_b32]|nr:MAG: hypothetical protein CEE43_06155 [Candidatus Lokiarchaeota archaeon Loki_b32]